MPKVASQAGGVARPCRVCDSRTCDNLRYGEVGPACTRMVRRMFWFFITDGDKPSVLLGWAQALLPSIVSIFITFFAMRRSSAQQRETFERADADRRREWDRQEQHRKEERSLAKRERLISYWAEWSAAASDTIPALAMARIAQDGLQELTSVVGMDQDAFNAVAEREASLSSRLSELLHRVDRARVSIALEEGDDLRIRVDHVTSDLRELTGISEASARELQSQNVMAEIADLVEQKRALLARDEFAT